MVTQFCASCNRQRATAAGIRGINDHYRHDATPGFFFYLAFSATVGDRHRNPENRPRSRQLRAKPDRRRRQNHRI